MLISVALAIAAVSIYAEQRSFLLGHLDQRVVAAAAPISYQLGVDATLLKRPKTDERAAVGSPARHSSGRGLVGFLPSGTYGALVGGRGQILRGPVTVNYGDRRLPGPAFPSRFPTFRAGTSPKLFTVGSKQGSHVPYRVAAVPSNSF